MVKSLPCLDIRSKLLQNTCLPPISCDNSYQQLDESLELLLPGFFIRSSKYN